MGDYKWKLLSAKERYRTLEIEEQLLLLLTSLSGATRESSISIIIDGRVACIPRSEIIYLSDIEKATSF
jgi:hypothetical protein